MTIKDLATQTGYSIGTVSRVLNNQPHVSDQARDVILRAAQECGFQLNTNAKQLKQQHSTSILVICKGNNNELFDSLLVAIQARLANTQYPLSVDYIDESENEVRRGVQLVREKKPLGILFLGGNREHFLADFHEIDLPCVLVTNDAAGLHFPNLSSVTADDTQAAHMAVSHLAAMGHRNIVVVGGYRSYSETTRLRYQGCLDAFCENGLNFTEDKNYETARFTYQDGYRAAQALLTRNPDFTALFAMSDVMAIGAIRGLKDAGRRVPEDVSVIGFDGLAIGEYTIPRLATVWQDVDTLAARSIQLLSRSIEDGAGACYETVPVQLLRRESAIEI